MIESSIYVADFNPDAARRWRRIMLDACRLLGRMPGVGHVVTDEGHRNPLRVFSKANYLIFYRTDAENVIILRVLHAARDWPKLVR